VSVADSVRHGEGAVRLRARWVVPVDLPPIEDGEVIVEGGVIISVGKAVSGEPGHDFGLAAILPGFVNSHAHLEYTVMRGLLEDMAFFPWIRTLTALKAHLTLEDWTASATLGAAEMAASGVTTIADASDAGASLAALLASGHRGIVYREVFGIEREPSTESILSVLASRVAGMRAQAARAGADERVGVGISPHAPYTVRPDLFRALAEFATRERLPQTIHLAESPAETDLIGQGSGPFAEMFRRRGIPWSPPGVSPTAHLDASGALTPGTLVVHTVHVDADDARRLRERGAAVAHCPKSNGKLAAGFAPVRTLLDAGLAVGLGTDSVASNNAADMFEEMRAAVFTARARGTDVQALGARDALRMATLGGAAALGLQRETGSLMRGKRADLCVVRLDGLHVTPTADDNPVAALVYGCRASDVVLTMADGRILYEAGRNVQLDVARLRHAVSDARKRLRGEVAKTVGAAQ
jgi:5-methylthioadenosine/S-adenosylhomocysteine deaminase